MELVQANELRHYELFQWLVALIAPIAVGFWTAYAIEPSQPLALWWSACVFTTLTVLFLGLALYYRRKVYHGSVVKSISLKDLN
ncbi:hypothetical protein C4552_02300 [Candidatus Parcubacteria bacterium]|nr:MAG: hypothetical protein C4552_02300 [Candidatus Parcubacteria bacterium]